MSSHRNSNSKPASVKRKELYKQRVSEGEVNTGVGPNAQVEKQAFVEVFNDGDDKHAPKHSVAQLADIDLDQYVENEEEPIKHAFDEHMVKETLLVRAFLYVIGRFPISVTKSKEIVLKEGEEAKEIEDQKVDKDKENNKITTWYRVNFLSVQGVLFIITTIIIVYMLITTTFSIFIITYNQDWDVRLEKKYGVDVRNNVRAREKCVLKRYYAVFMQHLCFLLNSLVGAICMIWKYKEVGIYFSLWSRSVFNSQFEVSKDIRKETYKIIGLTLAQALFVVPLSLIKIASMIGAPTMVAVLCFRWMSPLMLLNDDSYNFNTNFHIFQAMGYIFYILNFLWAKSYILLFYIKCKMLVNAIGNWNGRVYSAVLRKDHPQNKKHRTTYFLLFRDHCNLLDLVDGTNYFFEGIIETFFLSHIVTFVFEYIFFYRTLRFGHRYDLANESSDLASRNFFVRPYDWVSAFFVFGFEMLYFFAVLLAASEVNSELSGGLEITRRISMIGRKTDEELFFLFSLYTSFNANEQTMISGAGYFAITKELFITFMTIVSVGVVISFLYSPTYDHYVFRKYVGEFLIALEGLPGCHYISPTCGH